MTHKKLGTWSHLKGRDKKHKAVKTRFVFDIKHDAEGKMTRYTARLVAQRFNQVPECDFDETWAPVSNAATTRALFSVAATTGLEGHHVDVKTAFVIAKMDKEMYIKPPDDVDPKVVEEMCRLNLPLYGKQQAGRLCAFKLDKELKEMGAVRYKEDPYLYAWFHAVHWRVFILVAVVELIVAGEKQNGVEAVKRFVSAKFEVRDMGEVNDFIGMRVMRNWAAKTLTLSNPGHTATVLEAIRKDKETPNKTPMASWVRLTKTGAGLLPEGNRCAGLVGSLLYLSTTTRPDIAFAVGVLSRFMSCPEENHMRKAKGVLRYLRGTTRLGAVYGGSELLQGFVDADWAGDIDGRRSTTGFVFTCNGGPISWARKRQSTVYSSMAEAEYVAAAMATKELLLLRKLLPPLGVDGGAVPMRDDNLSCFALVNNPEETGRTKHVEVANHMARDYQARGDVAFYFLPSADMPADGLTKPLPSPAFTAFWAAVGVGEDLGVAARGAGLGDPLLGEC